MAGQRLRRAALADDKVRGGLSHKAYDPVSATKVGLGCYIGFYNTRQPHQSLDGQTPDAIYFAGLPQENLAA